MSDSAARYRVRHPAAPDLFVWCAGQYDEQERWFEQPLERTKTALGEFATLTVTFASPRWPMTKEEAEALAAFVGGTVEEVTVGRFGLSEEMATLEAGPQPPQKRFGFMCHRCGRTCGGFVDADTMRAHLQKHYDDSHTEERLWA